MQENQIWSLGQEDPPEKEMVTHSNIFAWEIPWTGSLVGYGLWSHKRVTVSNKTTTNENCYTFKGQAWEAEPWEWTSMYLSGYRQHSFVQNCRTSVTEHQQKVRAKGTDPIWSQVCSSVLQVPCYSRINPFLAGKITFSFKVNKVNK